MARASASSSSYTSIGCAVAGLVDLAADLEGGVATEVGVAELPLVAALVLGECLHKLLMKL